CVVRLDKQFDMTGERQDSPCACGKHSSGHIVWISNSTIAVRHMRCNHHLHVPEQFLVLDLLVGEAHQAFQRELIAKYLGPTQVEHLRADEALHQPENVSIGPTL